MGYRIGVDGGATKTECILVDPSGAILSRHVGPGCNPSAGGGDSARRMIDSALAAIHARLPANQGEPELTLLCMAGSRTFWREYGAALKGWGRVEVFDDSMPVLELATRGGPGLVVHAGTGSFVAARAPDGTLHYAGGLGWRFGDPGSGYDIGQRAIARALLEAQGWAARSGISEAVRQHTGLSDAAAISRRFYGDPNPNAAIAALAPAVAKFAESGDEAARTVLLESVGGLVNLACSVATRLFGSDTAGSFKAGLSGPILTDPIVRRLIEPLVPFPIAPVEGTPADGLRRMLAATRG